MASVSSRCRKALGMTWETIRPRTRGGGSSYASGFPLRFSVPYRPPRKGSTSRSPRVRYRIPRPAAYAQLVKKQPGPQGVEIEIYTRKRGEQALAALRISIPTSPPSSNTTEPRGG